MKFSKKIESCELSPVRKFYPYEAAAAKRGIKVHHLNIGQPDIETPKVFFDAIRNFSDKVLEYAPAPGIPEYVEAVRNYYNRLGCDIECGDILATYGGSEALQNVLACILDEGDEILVPEPFYPNYTTFVNVTGGKIVPIQTSAENGYHYADRALIEPLITERTRAILITNPGNPTGAVLSPAERRIMADIVKEHDLFLISDEVYREIVYGDDKPSTMLEFKDVAENVAVIDSVSKRFSATGSRVGALVSRNRALLGQAEKINQGRLCIGTLEQLGAAAMYNELGDDFYADTRAKYTERREAIVEALNKLPGVTYNDPEGAFYLMASLPVDDAEKLQYFMLEEFDHNGETMMFTPAEGFFSTPGKGRNVIRIAYVVSPETITRGVELLGLGIEAYNARQK